MKSTEYISIGAIAAVSGVVTYFIAAMVVGQFTISGVKVSVAEKVTDTVSTPDDKIFNADAINPTIRTTIGKQE